MESSYRETLLDCLQQAGALIGRSIGLKKKIDYKARLSLVTETDKEAERLVISAIRRRFPDHGILAEETGAHAASSPYRWIIDPLDGTTNFAHGFPMCCVSIALEENGTIILGGVLDPTRGELFYAERGGGAALNGKSISVSATQDLKHALLCTGYPYDRYKEDRADYYLGFTKAFLMRGEGVRRTGTAALDLCYVACGRYDGFWEFELQPWDVAAGRVIIEEAGGTVTGYRGEPYTLSSKQTLASNGKIHADMVTVLTAHLDKTKETHPL